MPALAFFDPRTHWKRNCILLAGAGVAAHWFFGDFLGHWWLWRLLGGIGEAVAIAGVLGLIVEYPLRKHLLQDVQSIIFGWALPPELKQHIRETSETGIVRQNYTAHYVITRRKHRAIVSITQSWDVYNFSAHPLTYPSSVAADWHDNPNLTSIRCEFRFLDNEPVVLTADELNKGNHFKPTTGSVAWALDPVELPPQEFDGKNQKPLGSVEWTYELETPADYSDVISFATACIGAEIEGIVPEDMEFECDDQPTMTHAPNSRWWRYKRLYMPGQCLRVRWRPKPSATPA